MALLAKAFVITILLSAMFGCGLTWRSFECGSISGVPGDFVLMERLYHPIPSEYYRKIFWRRPDGNQEFQLTTDTGGSREIEFELFEVRSAKLGTLKILKESEGKEIELGRFPESLSLDAPKRTRRIIGRYARGQQPACRFS